MSITIYSVTVNQMKDETHCLNDKKTVCFTKAILNFLVMGLYYIK